MMFITDWMKLDRDVYRVELPKTREGEGCGVAYLSTAPDMGQLSQSVVVRSPRPNISSAICVQGVHRHFKVDAKKTKRLRLWISDEKFEGAKRARNAARGVLRNLGAPSLFWDSLAPTTIYWCVEIEEK